MRWAKSYSIIDHKILHGGYLHRLSHQSLILYFFLVVVGDREGRSFYADSTIMDILRLSAQQLQDARLELLRDDLIDYQRPYWWVKNITKREPPQTLVDTMKLSPRQINKVDRDLAQRRIRDIIEEIVSRAKKKGGCLLDKTIK